MIILCSGWSQDKLPGSLEESTLSASKARSIMDDYNYYLSLALQ